MKAVWILEQYATREELEKNVQDALEMQANAPEEHKQTAADFVAAAQKLLDNNPNGHWYGTEGKIIYREFCEVSKAFIRRHKGDNLKLRVVKAEIADEAQYWLGYKNPVENEGVLKYLLATA